jgi:translation initiation factor IF-2
VSEVKKNTECGVSLQNFDDIRPGDKLQLYRIEYKQRVIGGTSTLKSGEFKATQTF